jgi:hypothetical protein
VAEACHGGWSHSLVNFLFHLKSNLVTNFKKRFSYIKIKAKINKCFSTTDLDISIDISRYDDNIIMDLNDTAVSDAEYHSADSYSLKTDRGPQDLSSK